MPKHKKMHANEDGWTDWVAPVVDGGYKFTCCDCGLVHRLEFDISPEDDLPIFRARRDNRSTGQIRRHQKQLSFSQFEMSPEQLIGNLVRNPTPKRRKMARWALVRDHLKIGHSMAVLLCKDYKVDPDEII